jgi:hypothetical protein
MVGHPTSSRTLRVFVSAQAGNVVEVSIGVMPHTA